MIEMVFVLLLWSSSEDQPIEYTPYDSLSECLATKRKIKRNIVGGTDFDQRWQCKEITVQLEKTPDGKFHITKLMEEVQQ